jgi:hypothetical protein
MSYADALADLKASFGPKKLLTMADIAPHIGKSRGAQTKLQGRGRFPVPVKKVGNTICVSIYDLAHLIGDEGEAAPAPRPVKTSAAKTPKAQRATTAKASANKPTRRPPSLGKLLRGYGKRLEELAIEIEAERMLFAELEAIDMARTVRPGRAEKRKTP